MILQRIYAEILILFYFIMTNANNRDNRARSSLPSFDKPQEQEIKQIYHKVELLRRQLNPTQVNQQRQLPPISSILTTTCHHQLIEFGIDRESLILKQRQLKFSQSSTQVGMREKTKSLVTVKGQRNQAKCLINFLSANKSAKPVKQTKIQEDTQQKEEVDLFEPLGEEYKKEKLYQQSLKSQTQSLSSSRNESLHSSNAFKQGRQSSKKYLRKGTRVRQILLRQLQTPDSRTSSASSLTYLKDYDQWVPTALVEEKKAQLQAFMSIIYGQKKSRKGEAVDLNKIALVYL